MFQVVVALHAFIDDLIFFGAQAAESCAFSSGCVSLVEGHLTIPQ